MTLKSQHICSLLTVFLLLACSQKEHVGGGEPCSNVYSEDSAMAHLLTEPERSITLLDSAVVVGNLSAERAEYLKAIVQLSGFNKPNVCIKMCQKLLDDKAWKKLPTDEDAVSFQVDLYRLMANAANSVDNQIGVVRYARKGVELAHGVKSLQGDEADLLSRMGLVLYQTGQTEEGLETMNRAEALALADPTWSSLLAYFNNVKKIYFAISESGQYDKAKEAILKALDRLDGLGSELADIQYTPEAMLNDSSALKEFVEYYQTPYYCYLSDIYALQDNPDSARYWLDRLKESSQHDNPSITPTAIRPLIMLGNYIEAEQYIVSVKDFLGADTVNEKYLKVLRLERILKKQTGRQQEAESISERVISLSDSIKNRNMQIMVIDATTQYQLNEERQHRAEAEDKLLLSIIALVIMMCIAIGTSSYLYIRKLHIKHEKLKEENIMIEEELESIIEENDIDSDNDIDNANDTTEQTQEIIFQRAVEAMEVDHKFKDPACNLGYLANMLNTNRTYISIAVRKYSGMNFRTWIAKYRVEYAKQLMLRNPSIKNDELAEQCGFDNRVNLYRNFKNFEGVTPNDWLTNQENPENSNTASQLYD